MKTVLAKKRLAQFATTIALSVGLAVIANAQTVLFDFGSDDSFRGVSVSNPDSNGNYWNSFRTGTFYVDLVDLNNVPTTIDFGFSTGVATDSYNGPAGVTSDFTLLEDVTFTDIDAAALGNLGGALEAAFDFVAGGPGAVRFEIQALDPAKTYDLTFFGSHKFSTDNTTIYNVYTDNTYTTLVDTVSLDHQDSFDTFFHNRDTVATISGVSPQESNILYVEFVGDEGNEGYLNSMQLVGSAVNVDIDDDGDVDGDDFLQIQRTDASLIPAWESQYGSGFPALAGLSSVVGVPEPASIALLMFGSFGCLLLRGPRHTL